MKSPFQAILFDFDGTLVQSNQIKRDTLFVVARTVGATDEQFAQVFDDHPRYDRFGLYRELLKRMDLGTPKSLREHLLAKLIAYAIKAAEVK